MRAAVRRGEPDPVAFALGLATGVAIFAFQEGPEWAVFGGLSVVGVAFATKYALDRWVRVGPTTPAPVPTTTDRPWYYPLTPRQSEVALLIAESLPSKEIAARLGIGERGVEATIQNIFNKLSDHEKRDFSHRTQIALWVRERQMAVAKPTTPPAPRGPVQR